MVAGVTACRERSPNAVRRLPDSVRVGRARFALDSRRLRWLHPVVIVQEVRMPTRRPSAVAFAVVTVVVLLGAAVSAHHSRAGYDTAKDRLTTLDAVVTEFIWRNPHVYLNWDAKDEKGTLVHWTG